MARPRLPIVPHLSPEEIARRYRACRDGVEKTHWQVLWLSTRSDTPPAPAEVAPQVGLTPVRPGVARPPGPSSPGFRSLRLRRPGR